VFFINTAFLSLKKTCSSSYHSTLDKNIAKTTATVTIIAIYHNINRKRSTFANSFRQEIVMPESWIKVIALPDEIEICFDFQARKSPSRAEQEEKR
jgi:hypothetical protein